MDSEKIDYLARLWIMEAAAKIKQSFKETLDIDVKSGRNDLVTNMDKETEAFFVKQIKEHFPDHRLFGEEGMAADVTDLDGIVWILDPIDGTLNFVEQQRDFAISLAVYENGVGRLAYIYDVTRDELYFGEKGKGATVNGRTIPKLDPTVDLEDALLIANLSVTRKFPTMWEAVKASRGLRLHGAASLEYMDVATSRAGAYLSANLAPWDIAAGKIIVEELGGKVTRINGEKMNMLEKGSSIVAAPKIHQTLLDNYLP
ncbi:inositol monophosphatase family protein [Listeria monocytogenes]|uniref:inositol monophosphatase family protein n=1 Tax=Listeria monocytogenes TaxID=1639 RepID=UPI0010B92EE5|nr:inositol monophosphatase family protein [Listeria monocytogenes]EAC5197819.1 inositol monophosphatase family protein [Listeria monocytogenes]EAC6223563.1 inositol monophosphatase family protein [Listeria monocytogenes]EAD0598032.1 inositol monophosphatase family protein [Listeria monocytogenes]EAD0699918.1 inositol monophosphatase family protein [Listeria monocytogenes]EAD1220780.1 inositol monophosphatase family protein [Listeria monocytogenes]